MNFKAVILIVCLIVLLEEADASILGRILNVFGRSDKETSEPQRNAVTPKRTLWQRLFRKRENTTPSPPTCSAVYETPPAPSRRPTPPTIPSIPPTQPSARPTLSTLSTTKPLPPTIAPALSRRPTTPTPPSTRPTTPGSATSAARGEYPNSLTGDHRNSFYGSQNKLGYESRSKLGSNQREVSASRALVVRGSNPNELQSTSAIISRNSDHGTQLKGDDKSGSQQRSNPRQIPESQALVIRKSEPSKPKVTVKGRLKDFWNSVGRKKPSKENKCADVRIVNAILFRNIIDQLEFPEIAPSMSKYTSQALYEAVLNVNENDKNDIINRLSENRYTHTCEGMDGVVLLAVLIDLSKMQIFFNGVFIKFFLCFTAEKAEEFLSMFLHAYFAYSKDCNDVAIGFMNLIRIVYTLTYERRVHLGDLCFLLIKAFYGTYGFTPDEITIFNAAAIYVIENFPKMQAATNAALVGLFLDIEQNGLGAIDSTHPNYDYSLLSI